jgi:hypothetical protein
MGEKDEQKTEMSETRDPESKRNTKQQRSRSECRSIQKQYVL